MMGGIPTNLDGQVLHEEQSMLAGLYAAGECACVSVHGANRLECNSLLDLVVFGRRAGKRLLQDLGDLSRIQLPKHSDENIRMRIQGLKEKRSGEKVGRLRGDLQRTMTEYCSVFRQEQDLAKAQAVIGSLMDQYQEVAIDNRGARFNTDLLEALELESLLSLADVMLTSARDRGFHTSQ
jgi:succinate dehydrogenase / fumarate reductase flavoprotein subunit